MMSSFAIFMTKHNWKNVEFLIFSICVLVMFVLFDDRYRFTELLKEPKYPFLKTRCMIKNRRVFCFEKLFSLNKFKKLTIFLEGLNQLKIKMLRRGAKTFTLNDLCGRKHGTTSQMRFLSRVSLYRKIILIRFGF